MKLVIFDCDGTIVDSQHNIIAAMAHAFDALGLSVPARPRILGCVGLSLPETFAVLAGEQPAPVQRSLAAHYRDAFLSGAIPRREREPVYPGVREAIETLSRQSGVLLGIATGKSRRGVARLLDSERWQGRFLTIQTADDHPSKPHPSMILTAMAEAGVEAETTVMIGDTAFDMAMARSAGVGAVGVTWGYHDIDRLNAAGAHDIVEHGASLVAAIERRLAHQAGDRPE